MSPQITEKGWATLRAMAALHGLTLHRTDPADGPVRVIAVGSSGRVCVLSDARVSALLGEVCAAHEARGQ